MTNQLYEMRNTVIASRRRSNLILFLILTICFSISFAQEQSEEKLRLAIMDLGAQDVSAMTATKVSDLLRTAIFNTELFTVIERNEMETILKEQAFTLTGCTDERCGVKIGQLLSANKILVGMVMKLGEKIIINARIVDVEKGKLDFAEKTSCTKVEELDAACDEFANKLSARITGKPYQPTTSSPVILSPSKAGEESLKEVTGKPYQPSTSSPVIPTPPWPRKNLKEITGKDDAPMVLIPEGEFTMGSDIGESDEKPPHKVYLDAYYIDKYEVTFEQYDKFCEAIGRNKPSDNGWGRGNRPVINVTWNDAVAYAKWAGKRLPTEAEWEKAARAGSNTKYCFGDSVSELGDYGWYKSNSGDKTHPVGEKKPNRWGIYDIYGNVSEWCSDWYEEEYYKNSPDRNPKGPDNWTFHVVRGGSWSGSSGGSWWYDVADDCRSAVRNRNVPSGSSNGIGFRCVRSGAQ